MSVLFVILAVIWAVFGLGLFLYTITVEYFNNWLDILLVFVICLVCGFPLGFFIVVQSWIRKLRGI